MARIGIIGSSFSEGHQPYLKHKIVDRKHTLRFEVHLKNHMPEHDFFNLALSGQGSERFLENTILLKDKYNIDILLIENIEDRSHNRLWVDPNNHREMLADIEQNPERRKFYTELLSSQDCRSMCTSIFNNYLNHKNTLLEQVPVKKVKNWVDVQSYIFYKDVMLKLLGIKNVENTVKLCNFLNITPVHWSQRHESCFLNDNGLGVREYINQNWKGKFEVKHSSDGTHCNDEAVDRLCKEYYKPILENVL